MKKIFLLFFLFCFSLSCDHEKISKLESKNYELTVKIEELQYQMTFVGESSSSCEQELRDLQTKYDDLENQMDDLADENYNNGYNDGWNDGIE